MTEPTYAAEIVDGTVAQVIVGTAAWAVEHLGGVWVDPPGLVGIGWTYDGTNIVPPPDVGAQGDLDDPLQYNVI
jgi:hypothetical protein